MTQTNVTQSGSAEPKRRRSRRRKTAHLKKVPESLALRQSLRDKCRAVVDTLDRSNPLSKDEMESICRHLLSEADLPEAYLGWTMVILSSEFWKDQVAAVPPERRLFLLPHCLKHAEGCPADYDQFGLDCKTCGACSIADFRKTADEMGYKVLVAEGSPIVLKIIVSGYVDAIVGVACLNVLEKAIDKILLAGIPCMAVPLLSSDCRNTSVDEDWVEAMVATPHVTGTASTRTWIHLLRHATGLFEPERLESLVPRSRRAPRLAELNGQGITGLDPVAATESIAFDFLGRGGKHSRPFITLAAYDALTEDRATTAEGPSVVKEFPEYVLRTAISIETFHKASLVHDDIEDDDAYRYGQESIHRRFGVPTAINVGDYLIGLGYRLVSRDANDLGGERAAAILDLLADAHIRLSEGQGAELLWREGRQDELKPIDALKVYALKTAPAFEAALLAGVRLATDSEEFDESIRAFSRHIGVAFQILNDLKDWDSDDDNKLVAGADVLSGRPTLLLALALESLDREQRDELLSLVRSSELPAAHRMNRVRQLFQIAGVFDKANSLVEKYQVKAEEVAEATRSEALRRLLWYLIDSVLARSDQAVVPTIEFTEPGMKDALPIVASS